MAGQASSRSSSGGYASLEPRIHHVSAAKVKKKWKRLAPNSQQNVRELLISLEQQTRSKKAPRQSTKDVEAEAFVRQVAEKLIERLPRMPFPPSAIDESFDFELNLHRIRSIEEHLASNTLAMNLLNTQIKLENRLLEEDQAEVETLEESLRSNDSHRLQQSKSFHPLARALGESFDQASKLELEQLSGEPVSLQHNAVEPEAATALLLQDLHSHLDSMQSNTAALHDVADAVDLVKHTLLRVMLQLQTT